MRATSAASSSKSYENIELKDVSSTKVIDETHQQDDIPEEDPDKPKELGRDAIGPESTKKPPYSAFSTSQKYLILVIVTCAGFMGPVSGNIYIPLLPQFQQVFNTTESTINATVSVFMAVFAIAPLLWASCADFGGRKLLYLISLLFFLLANILLASVPANIAALFILRILQAFGASSLMSVGAGTIADVFEPRDRGKVIGYYMMGPQLGPILGPILSIIAAGGQWRWIFGFLTIYGGIIYLVILFCLPETLRYFVGNGEAHKGLKPWSFLPKRLKQKRLVKDPVMYPKPPKPTIRGVFKVFMYKPAFLCCFNSGLLFATFYGMSVTFSRVLKDNYGFTNTQQSVSYICPGISLICGSVFGGHLSDFLRKRSIGRNPGDYYPEYRITPQILGLLISMTGILGYGWCIEKHVHLAAVFVFTFIAGFGMTWVFVTSTVYLTECSTGQPATNVAIGNFFKNASASLSSGIIDILIKKMGFGWCFTGLALIDLIGVVVVFIIILHGPKWRKQWEIEKQEVIERKKKKEEEEAVYTLH